MKITIKEPPEGAEEEIIVLCHKISPKLLNMLNSFKTSNNMFAGYIDSSIHMVSPLDIFYFEAVDNKTFIYCECDIYESKLKLYELEELQMTDFFRISRSVIVNLSKIKSLTPSFSGRVEAVLINKEKVIISRQYASELKKALGI